MVSGHVVAFAIHFVIRIGTSARLKLKQYSSLKIQIALCSVRKKISSTINKKYFIVNYLHDSSAFWAYTICPIFFLLSWS